ncbi:hypothetical protein THRCLA_00494 [Thraustotheca clavata]|uniref:Expansin-like EG45 domain-containing protein n=1 Tax=Thraustotheca clavata TaxID=74557 RepID=A0A1W0ABD8_9STRA|nr:hypothetical protein THRCLA_00494 [Thraustotheca clavata]
MAISQSIMRSLLVLFAVAATTVRGQYTGEGTTYGPPDGGDPGTGNCALMKYLDIAPKFHAAMNNFQWETGAHCGRCVQVQCNDPRCTSSESVVGQITDRCPECQHGDLDMSLPMFNKITGMTTGRPKIKWQFVNCPVQGGVQICAKSGSSQFWLYIQASNALNGVSKMSINGANAPLFSSSYYFMSQVNGVQLSDTKVSITSPSGETITTSVSLQADQCTQISQQFTQGVGPAPAPAPSSDSPKPSPSPATPAPTQAPTQAPTKAPTDAPTQAPTKTPAPTTTPTTTQTATTTPASTTGTPAPTQTTVAPTTPLTTTVPVVTNGTETSSPTSEATEATETSETPVSTLIPASTAASAESISSAPQPTSTGGVEISVKASSGSDSSMTTYLVAGAGALVLVAAVVLVFVVKRSRQKYLEEKESDASFDGPIMRFSRSETSHANVAIL